MPLSEPAPREAHHHRSVEYRGYRREDGLWDIEAHLTDTKSFSFESSFRGAIGPDEPIHDMWIRLTVDETFVVRRAEAATDASPFAICPAVTPAFAKLEGVSIGRGWSHAVRERMGGVQGCTHLVELVRAMATVAFQTIRGDRDKAAGSTDGAKTAAKPLFIDGCHALDSRGDIVRQQFPEWYSGA